MYECPLFAWFWNATYACATTTNSGTEQMMDAMSIHFFLLNSEMMLTVHLSDASTYVVCTYAVCKKFLNVTSKRNKGLLCEKCSKHIAN